MKAEKAEILEVVYEEVCVRWRCPACGNVQEDVGMRYLMCDRCGWRGVLKVRYEIRAIERGR